MTYYYVYVLYNDIVDKKYIGYTNNVERRLAEHNSGKSKYTKAYIPWKLIYFESYGDESAARKRERELKKSSWHKEQLFKRLFD